MKIISAKDYQEMSSNATNIISAKIIIQPN